MSEKGDHYRQVLLVRGPTHFPIGFMGVKPVSNMLEILDSAKEVIIGKKHFLTQAA